MSNIETMLCLSRLLLIICDSIYYAVRSPLHFMHAQINFFVNLFSIFRLLLHRR